MFTKSQKTFLIGSVVLGLLAAGAVSYFQKPYIEASQSFIVRNDRHEAYAVYDYEGYYTLQTANEGAKTLVSWLVSPGGVDAVYQKALVEHRFQKLRDYERAFAVRRSDTPFFEVRFKARTIPEAERLSAALESLLRGELGGFQSSALLSLSATQVVLLERPVPHARNLFYGGGLAMLFAVFAILMKKALETNEPSS